MDRVLQGGHSRFTPSYVVTLANAPIIFKAGLQGLTAQSTMEAELMAAALAMKDEAVFCSDMMSELGFGESFGSVPLHIDNTSALHVAGNRTYIPRAKHIALRYYFFLCKNWWRARSASTTSKARISWQTWAPSTIASTVTATQSSASASLRLETPASSSITKGRSSSFCASNTCVFTEVHVHCTALS